MRRAGRVVAEMHDRMRAAAIPGVTTQALDAIGREVLAERGARSNFLGYHGFPGVACISVNEEVVHGIPRDRVLVEGDVVSIDCGAIVDGWHGDAAITVGIGTVDQAAQHLIEVTRQALDDAVAACVVGNRIGAIGAAVESIARREKFGLVREYTGHGIGRAMHEAPDIPNYGPPNRGAKLAVGNTICIEPMLTEGSGQVNELEDGWTVVCREGGRSAHWEHTVLVGEDGPEVLTAP